MPSKTRGTRATKASKENISAVKTNTLKGSGKISKSARKPLSDKTNSASDDNASTLFENPRKSVDAVSSKELCENNAKRPRRARRLPTRYKESEALKNLSNSLSPKEGSPTLKTVPSEPNAPTVSKTKQKPKVSFLVKKKTSPVQKLPLVQLKQSKSPVEVIDCSSTKDRPKRVCRLPSRFEDHSISPNKYMPVQPINASTPLATKTKNRNNKNAKEIAAFIAAPENITPIKSYKNIVPVQKAVNNSVHNISPDSNNNAKQNNKQQSSPPKLPGKILSTRSTTRNLRNKNDTLQILDDNRNQRKRDSSKLDVYEFTFDPAEEPPPAKKKKNKTAPKRPKPKTITVKSNYDKNLAKALAALKKAVSSRPPPNTVILKQREVQDIRKEIVDTNHVNTELQNVNIDKELSTVNEKNYNSVRVEDIAHDMQDNEDDHVIDYSPVNSPGPLKTSADPVHDGLETNNADPLNLQDDFSFFDDLPVASSSMNVSARHPLASPWRPQFDKLPLKWHVNTYVKPNLTPAIECSFVNFNDSKKKHVYTNMVPENNDPLPELVENTPNLIQTSIISFIKEVVEKSTKKKNRVKSTPVKDNSLFEDPTTSIVNYKTPNKYTPLKNNTTNSKTPETNEKQLENSINNDIVHEKECSESLNKQKETECAKTPMAMKDVDNADKNNTYFGFDDSENQENISPIKKNNRAKSLRSRTRGILQEINEFKGPTRAFVPIAAKSKNNLHQEIKSATEPPIFPEVTIDGNSELTTVQESCLPENLDNEDTQSVHLFEDIEFKHHYRPNRKSYGKAKRVQIAVANSDDSSISDTDVNMAQAAREDEDFDDISFKLPSEKPKRANKKRKRKNLLSKKEEKEVEAWAAGFNSMCEDIDGFDLVVEE